MKIVAEQLWALMNAQKLTRPDLKLRVVRSYARRGSREQLPDAYLRAFGSRNTASGRWRYLPTPPLSLAWNLLASTKGNSQWRKDSGLDSLTTRQMVDRWSRFSSIIPAHHMDNHRFGVNGDSYERLRWRGSWKRRQTKGWSAAAICTWWKCEWVIWLCDSRDRNNHPEWYTCHQP